MGSKGAGHLRAFEDALVKFATLDQLRRAIDKKYARLLESAREEWERKFADEDPSNACVSVHIDSTAREAPASKVPCAGYLPKRESPRGGKTRPRLA